MVWKPSYGDAEVAGCFVYLFSGQVRSHSIIGVTGPIIHRWKGRGEANPTARRAKESGEYSWRTSKISVSSLIFMWKWAVLCRLVYTCMKADEGDSFCAREVTGIGFGFIFFIYLFWDKLYIPKIKFSPFIRSEY